MIAPPITDDELAQARALCDAATPGPWRPCGANNDRCVCGLVWANEHVPLQGEDEQPNPTPDDVAFIAASRSLLPRLLDEVMRLRKLVVELGTSLTPGAAEALQAAVQQILDSKCMAERAALRAEVEEMRGALNSAMHCCSKTRYDSGAHDETCNVTKSHRLRAENECMRAVVLAARAVRHAWRDSLPVNSYQSETRRELHDALDAVDAALVS